MERASGRVLFVYYKIDRLQDAALLRLVKEFQQQLKQAWPALSCELMQRPAVSAEFQTTWMEIYRHPDTLSDQIIDDIAMRARDMQLPACRFTEIFVPLQ